MAHCIPIRTNFRRTIHFWKMLHAYTRTDPEFMMHITYAWESSKESSTNSPQFENHAHSSLEFRARTAFMHTRINMSKSARAPWNSRIALSPRECIAEEPQHSYIHTYIHACMPAYMWHVRCQIRVWHSLSSGTLSRSSSHLYMHTYIKEIRVRWKSSVWSSLLEVIEQ